MRVLIAGTGLIGTSVGLALRRQGHDVQLWDVDTSRARTAAGLGAGITVDDLDDLAAAPVDHAVVAVPPEVTPQVVSTLLRLGIAATVSDVSAVQTHHPVDIEISEVDASAFCGSHPMAGSEQSGPAAARPDLFDGRAWAITPHAKTSPAAAEAARRIAVDCGAVPIILEPQAHDDAVALVSHVPQLVASALAALLQDAPDEAVGLAGQGLRDTTRIAASEPSLWGQIVSANAEHVTRLLRRLRDDLDGLIDAIDPSGGSGADAAEAVESLIRRGNVGRSRLPGKHGARRLDLAVLNVVVADEPGQLARLLGDASRAGVNVEDLNVEHALGRPSGVVQLSVRPEVVAELAGFLDGAGWSTYTS